MSLTDVQYKRIQDVLRQELERVEQITQDDTFDPYYTAGRYQGVQNICYRLAEMFEDTSITFDRDKFLLDCGLKVITARY